MEQIVAHLSNQRRKLKEVEQLEDPGRISAMVDVALISLYNRLTNRTPRSGLSHWRIRQTATRSLFAHNAPFPASL